MHCPMRSTAGTLLSGWTISRQTRASIPDAWRREFSCYIMLYPNLPGTTSQHDKNEQNNLAVTANAKE